jgi:ribose transport system substrate-binding protein
MKVGKCKRGATNVNKRDFLKLAAGGLSAACLPAALTYPAQAASAFNPTACFAPWDPATQMFTWKAKKPPYRIAIANSLIGNDWRTEMVKLARAYAARPDVKPLIKELTISSSGNDISAQISQFNQLILSGVDVIITDAASPTGINSVIEEAAEAGILVLSFDNVVTTQKAVWVNHDQTDMGRIWARFIAKETGGKGTVLMVRGVAGTFGDEVFSKGGMEIFSKYPDLKLVQVNGNWDQGTAQKVASDALASGKTFDGVWSEYGDTGVVRAFLEGPGKVPPIAGQSENGFRKLAARHKFAMLSAGVSPGLVAVSMQAAFHLLGGNSVPQQIRVALDMVTTDQLKAGVNYFPDLPDSFVAGFNVPVCDLEFSATEILAQTA